MRCSDTYVNISRQLGDQHRIFKIGNILMASLHASKEDAQQQDPAPPPVSPPSASALPRSSCRLELDGRLRWALTSCSHCRDYKHSSCVLTCYGKVAHHREVVLVDDDGVRSSIGVLADGLGPPPIGMLGRTVVLDQSAVDNGLICTVSCPVCAGQPLGGCIDAGHEQQERYTENLPPRITRRLAMPRKSLVVDIGGSGTTSSGAAAHGSGEGTAGGAGKRTFVCANGTRYVMPFYIYYNQSGFKVELSYRKGQFLVNGFPCGPGKVAFGSKPAGLTFDHLLAKMILRDMIWWEKSGDVHPVVAAQLFRAWWKPSPSDLDDDVVTFTLNMKESKAAQTLSMTKGELREMNEKRAEHIDRLWLKAWETRATYAERPEECASTVNGGAPSPSERAPAATVTKTEKRSSGATKASSAKDVSGGERPTGRKRSRGSSPAVSGPSGGAKARGEVSGGGSIDADGKSSSEGEVKSQAKKRSRPTGMVSPPDERDWSEDSQERAPSPSMDEEHQMAMVVPVVTHVVPDRDEACVSACGDEGTPTVSHDEGSCVEPDDDASGDVMIPRDVVKPGEGRPERRVDGTGTSQQEAAKLSLSPSEKNRDVVRSGVSACSATNDLTAEPQELLGDDVHASQESSSSRARAGLGAREEDTDHGRRVSVADPVSPANSGRKTRGVVVGASGTKSAIVDAEGAHDAERGSTAAPALDGGKAGVRDIAAETGAGTRAGTEAEAGEAKRTKGAAAKRNDHLRMIEEARFVECQRREMEDRKRRCREELAPLEAALEALKQRLRKDLRELAERHVRDRETFCAALYRDVNGEAKS